MSEAAPTYRIETGVSVTGFGVLYPVRQVRGQCSCGQVHMSRIVGYFPSREDAESYVSMVTYLEGVAADPAGRRIV